LTRGLEASYVDAGGRLEWQEQRVENMNNDARPGKMAVIIPAAFINSLAIGTMSL